MARGPLLLLALMPLVTACNADDTNGSGDQPGPELFSAAFEKAIAAGTSRTAFSTTITIGDTSSVLSGEGVLDHARRRGHVTYDLADLVKTHPHLGAKKMELVLDGAVFYMHIEASSVQLPHGKSWLMMDLRRLGRAPRADLAQLMQLGQSPAQQLHFLRAASEPIDKTGTDELRGVETSRYRVWIDLPKAADLAADSVPADMRLLLLDSIERLTVAMEGQLLTDVWIDGDGLPRKIFSVSPIRVRGDGGLAGVAMEMYDFGVPLKVELPPRKKTIDIFELLDDDSLEEAA